MSGDQLTSLLQVIGAERQHKNALSAVTLWSFRKLSGHNGLGIEAKLLESSWKHTRGHRKKVRGLAEFDLMLTRHFPF